MNIVQQCNKQGLTTSKCHLWKVHFDILVFNQNVDFDEGGREAAQSTYSEEQC